MENVLDHFINESATSVDVTLFKKKIHFRISDYFQFNRIIKYIKRHLKHLYIECYIPPNTLCIDKKTELIVNLKIKGIFGEDNIKSVLSLIPAYKEHNNIHHFLIEGFVE